LSATLISSQAESGGVIPMTSMALALPVDPVVDFDPPQAPKSNMSPTATDFMVPVIATHGNSSFVTMPIISGEV
jgi:hypothetical protein